MKPDEPSGLSGPLRRIDAFVSERVGEVLPAEDARAGVARAAREAPTVAEVAQQRLTQLKEYRKKLKQAQGSARRRGRGRRGRRGEEGLIAGLAAQPPPGANWVPIGPLVAREGQAATKPLVSGRVPNLAVSSDGRRVYVASANGGVWGSPDAGRTWRALSDEFDVDPTQQAVDSLACGAIALVDGGAADQDRLYVGTGEGFTVFQGSFPSSGAYLGVGPIASTDGGRTWTQEAAAPSLLGHAFFALAVDPGDPEHAVGGTTNGVYRRVLTGGVPQWNQQAMPAAVGAGAEISCVVAARDGTTTSFYAAVTGIGVVTSSSAGGGAPTAWTQLAQASFPTAGVGRISLGISAASPRALYALVAKFVPGGHASGGTDDSLHGVYRLDLADAALRWRKVDGVDDKLFGDATDPDSGTQGSYDQAIAVDPATADRFVVAGSIKMHAGEWSGAVLRCNVRTSGTGAARTFSVDSSAIGSAVHGDVHWLAYRGSDELWLGCDGGLFVTNRPRADGDIFESRNTGLTTMTLNGLAHHPTHEAYVFCGGQDSGGLRYDGGGVWFHQLPGDGGATVIDWNNPTRFLNIYTTSTIRRARTDGARYSSESADVPLASGEGVLFYPPMAGPPPDGVPAHALRVAFGSRRVWISDDFGSNWASIPNGTLAADNLGSLVRSLTFVSHTRLFAGTRDGQVIEFNQGVGGWASTNHGRPNGVRPVTSIAPDLSDATGASVFVTLGGASTANRVWHWSGAAPWTARSTGLLDTQHNAIVADPGNPTHLYVGADIGVWHTVNSGTAWTPLSFGLPDTAVLDLDLHAPAGVLRATTFGRGVFEMPVPPGGAPQPGVQLMVRTNQLESGRRAAPTGVANPIATSQNVGPDQSPDIKTDAPDGNARYRVDPAAPVDIAQFVEVLPAAGEILANRPDVPAVTRVYVQVHNLGVTAAGGVRVMLLVGTPGPGGRRPLPAGFETNVANGTPIETPDWRTAGIRTVDGVAAGRPAVVGFDLRSDLLPPADASAGTNRHLLALVHHPDDAFTTATTAVDTLVVNERKAGLRTVRVAAAQGSAASGAATGSAGGAGGGAPPTGAATGVGVLTPAAVAMLAHARLGDAVDGLERKVNGARVEPVLGGFSRTVRPAPAERQVLALARAARDMFRDGSTITPSAGHPLAGMGGYALLGAMGFEIPGYAGLLLPGGGWVADALRRGTPDPNRSHVRVPAVEFAVKAGQLGIARATTDLHKARVRAFTGGMLSAAAAGALASPQLRDLMARETNLDWERWRAHPGARAVDELVRRRFLAGAAGDRLAGWFPPSQEVPEALWQGYVTALEQVYGLPGSRVAGFSDFEERFDAGDWLTASRLANAYDVFKNNLGTTSWHWAAWWGLLSPIVLGPSITLLAARALPNASKFSRSSESLDEHAVYELLQLGLSVGSVAPFVYSMILWGAVDEHTEPFVNALLFFIARAALGIGGLAASENLSAKTRWPALFLPMAAIDVYSAIRAIVGATRGRPGVATIFGINTIPSLTALASLGFGGLIKLLVDATDNDDLWWLWWALVTAGMLFGVGIPVAVALSRGGGIWSWFLRRDPRFPLLGAVSSAGTGTGPEPVAFGRTFDDSTLWPDPAAGAPAANPDLVHHAYPSGMRALARIWREGDQALEVAHDDHVVRMRPAGAAEQTITVGPQGTTAADLVARLPAGIAGVTAEVYGSSDPSYRLPWPATVADPGDALPKVDHEAARLRYERAGKKREEALILRHGPRAETSTTAGMAGASRSGTDAFPVVPAAEFGDVEATGLGAAADLAVLLTMAAAPALAGGSVTVADGLAPGLPASQVNLGEVSEVFRRWNLDERRLNEWLMLVGGGATSEKRGTPSDADPLMRPRAAANPAPGGEVFATAMGWVPLWRAWLRVATDPAADGTAALAMPYTPEVALPDGTRRRLTNAELTLGLRFLLELQ